MPVSPCGMLACQDFCGQKEFFDSLRSELQIMVKALQMEGLS
jgi:hypothetical protein